ncbi:MAG TPA: type II CRISPR-associated endonuclease Cas1 [Clostridium sp.]|nr:type II CRISPR-associated endonuclease Cas1 [Clostridium sp.]
MSFRSVIITNSCNLAVKDRSLTITNNEKYKIPLEDINTLVIDGIGITITNNLLSDLADNNISAIICDKKHLPNTIILPLNSHYKAYKIIKEQLELTEPFKKRIWQLLIKQKLMNQGICLELLNLNGAENLFNLKNDVRTGDLTNRESVGARFYFKVLFGENFKRSNEDIVNSALNYGYTIMRSAIARALTSHGFNCLLGVNHCNELNSFNLADDFIEPFRPIVDLWVYKNVLQQNEFTKKHRIELINLLNYECVINNGNQSILNAINIMIGSYSTCCFNNNYRLLKLPVIKALKYHLYE